MQLLAAADSVRLKRDYAGAIYEFRTGVFRRQNNLTDGCLPFPNQEAEEANAMRSQFEDATRAG